MREAMAQFMVGIGGVFAVFMFSAFYKVAFGGDPPLGEAAIAGVVTISVGRTATAGYVSAKAPPIPAPSPPV